MYFKLYLYFVHSHRRAYIKFLKYLYIYMQSSTNKSKFGKHFIIANNVVLVMYVVMRRVILLLEGTAGYVVRGCSTSSSSSLRRIETIMSFVI